MKRQIVICVVLFLVLIIFVLLLGSISNSNSPKDSEKETEQIQTEMQTEETTKISKDFEYGYYILESEGRLTVYETTNHTVFLETAIKASLLSDEMKEKLKNGIYFKTDKDMYDFLESYSS